MSSKIIKKIEHKILGDQIVCDIIVDDEVKEQCSFAFYVFRGSERIFAGSYSDNTHFVFDTGGRSGYYRISAFAKLHDGPPTATRVGPLFVKPKVSNGNERFEPEHDGAAYMLQGSHWEFPTLFYHGSDDDYLFVMLPAAANRKDIELPSFNRWTWASQKTFPGKVLCVADPTLSLDPDLGIGWCIGTADKDATADLAALVEKLAQANNIPLQNVVFYGSSAGGYAALAVASLVPGSTAVAINPQTDVLTYGKVASKQVALVRQNCFACNDENKVRENFGDRISIIKRWREDNGAFALIVQNRLDPHHYDYHFKPFWESLGGSAVEEKETIGNVTAWLYEDVGGHVPETQDMARDIAKQIICSVPA